MIRHVGISWQEAQRLDYRAAELGERPDAVLARAAEPGPLELQIELACNGMFGEKGRPAELRRCDIALFDPRAWQLFYRPHEILTITLA